VARAGRRGAVCGYVSHCGVRQVEYSARIGLYPRDDRHCRHLGQRETRREWARERMQVEGWLLRRPAEKRKRTTLHPCDARTSPPWEPPTDPYSDQSSAERSGYCASFALLCVPIEKGGVFNAAFPLHVKAKPTIHNPYGNSLEKASGPALQQQRTALIPCLKMMLAAGS